MTELKNISSTFENTSKSFRQNIPLYLPLLSDVVVTIFELKLRINSKWATFVLCHYCIHWATARHDSTRMFRKIPLPLSSEHKQVLSRHNVPEKRWQRLTNRYGIISHTTCIFYIHKALFFPVSKSTVWGPQYSRQSTSFSVALSTTDTPPLLMVRVRKELRLRRYFTSYKKLCKLNGV